MTRVKGRKTTPTSEEKKQESLMASISESETKLIELGKEKDKEEQNIARLSEEKGKLELSVANDKKTAQKSSEDVVAQERKLQEINIDIVAANNKLDGMDAEFEARKKKYTKELKEIEKSFLESQDEIQGRLDKLVGQEKTERQAYGALLNESERVATSIAKRKIELSGIATNIDAAKVRLSSVEEELGDKTVALENKKQDLDEIAANIVALNAEHDLSVGKTDKVKDELGLVEAKLKEKKEELAKLEELNISIIKRGQRLDKLIPEIKELYAKAGLTINLK